MTSNLKLRHTYFLDRGGSNCLFIQLNGPAAWALAGGCNAATIENDLGDLRLMPAGGGDGRPGIVVSAGAGNVGVCTSAPNPAFALDVGGDVTVSGLMSTSNLFTSNATVVGTLYTSDVSISGKYHGDGSLLTNLPSSGGSSGSGVAMFKNAVINGNMLINQRNTKTTWGSTSTPASTASDEASTTYVADRFSLFRDGFVTGGACCLINTSITSSLLLFTNAGISSYARIGRKSADTSTAPIHLRYAFEAQDTYTFYGQTVTLSFYYYTGANFSGTTLNYGIITGNSSVNSLQRGFTPYSSQTTTISPTTTWTRATFTCTLPSLTSSVFYLGLDISYTPSGTAGTNDWFNITGVQLEKGSSATAFEYRPYTIEYQLCRRYCLGLKISNMFIGFNWGTYAAFNIPLQVPMRIMPSISYQNSVIMTYPNMNQYGNLSPLSLSANCDITYQLIMEVPNASMGSEIASVSISLSDLLVISAEL